MRRRTMGLLVVAFFGGGCSGRAVPFLDGAAGDAASGPDLHRVRDLLAADLASDCEVTVVRLNGLAPGQLVSTVPCPLPPVLKVGVEVQAVGVPDGMKVRLSVTNVSPDPLAVVKGGAATFTSVPLDTNLPAVSITPRVSGCGTMMTLIKLAHCAGCAIAHPQNGSSTKQTTAVLVQTTKIPQGSPVELLVEGVSQGNQLTDALEQATFSPVTLPKSAGMVTLEARVTAGGSVVHTCQSVVTVVP